MSHCPTLPDHHTPTSTPAPPAAVAKSTTLKFDPIEPSITNEEKNEPRSTPKVTLYRADRTPAPLRRPARGLRQRWF